MEFQTHIISCVLNISTGMAHQPADSVCPTTELLFPTPILPAAISGLLVSTRHRPSPPPLTQPVPCSVCESACQVLSLLSSPFLSAQGPSLHQNAIALSTDVLVPLVFSVACCSAPNPLPSSCHAPTQLCSCCAPAQTAMAPLRPQKKVVLLSRHSVSP